MKKLLFIPLAAVLVYVGFLLHQPQMVVTPAKVQTVRTSEPAFYLGDKQSDSSSYMILESASTQQQTTGMMSAAPENNQVATFQLETNVSQTQLMHQALIYTSDGQYLKPTEGPYQVSCDGTCVSFLTPPNVQIDTFIYKNFRWFL